MVLWSGTGKNIGCGFGSCVGCDFCFVGGKNYGVGVCSKYF